MSRAKNAATEDTSFDARRRRCPRCSASLKLSARFCFECGMKIEPLTTFSEEIPTVSDASPSITPQLSSSQALKHNIFDIRQSPVAALLERHQVSQTLYELYFQLGVALAHQHDYDRSAEAFEQALKEKTGSIPSSSEVIFYLAYMYELTSTNDRAFRCYLEAVLLAPESINSVLLHVHSLLSPNVALTHSNWVTTAWVYILDQQDITPFNRMHIKLLIGRIHLYLANYQQALDCFKEAMELDFNVAPTLLDTILAPEALPPALAASEKDGNMCFILAQLYFTSKNWQLALEEVNRALNLGLVSKSSYPDAPALELKAQILEVLRAQEEAGLCFYEAGRNYYWSGEYESAIKQFSCASQLQPDHIATYWYWADALLMSSYKVEFPYIEKKPVDESLRVWNSAFNKKAPDASYAWVYVTRALMNEQLARLQGPSSWKLFAESIVYLERGLLLGQQDISQAHLAIFYRYMNYDANALWATRLALEAEPTKILCLEERASVLANAGKFEEAGQVIEIYLQQGEYDSAKTIKALILFYIGHYKDALDLLTSALDRDPDNIWVRDLQTYCFRRLGDISQAEEASRRIWEWYCSIAAKYPEAYLYFQKNTAAWAAYQLGKIDEALALFESLRDEPIHEPGSIGAKIGLCYLAQGNLVNGEENLSPGIEQMTNIRLLNDIEVDLAELRKRTSNWSSLDQTRLEKVLSQLIRKIQLQKRKVSRRPSPEKELKTIIRKYPRKSEIGSHTWIGANAGLARLYGEEKRWAEAARVYQLLIKEDVLFPEAHHGLQKALEKIQEEGDDFLREGKFERALECFSQALAFMLKSFRSNPLMLADLHSRLGFVYLNLTDLAAARTHFTQAIQLYQQNTTGSTPGDVCRFFLRDAAQYWHLEESWNALLKDPEIDEGLLSDFIAAKRSWASSLDNLFQHSQQPDEEFTAAGPLPIIVEIGEGLIPEDTTSPTAFIDVHIPQMRQRLQTETGVTIPGVRLRGNYSLPPDGYNFLLFENPVVLTQRVQLNRRYCPELPERIQSLGIPTSDLIQAPHPLEGWSGCWVPPNKYELVTSHNLELWDEPQYITYHLEAIVRRNLAEFWGMQEQEAWLHGEGEDENLQKLITSVLSDQQAQFFLARVLRTLLQEQVPITNKRDILTVFWQSRQTENDLNATVRDIRIRLKRWLPANQPTAQRIEVPHYLEDGLTTGLEHIDGQTYFTAPPQAALRFLSVIRRNPLFTRENVALVIENATLRPFLQLLFESEFPSLAVLSKEEVLPQGEALSDATRTEGVNTDEE